MPNRFFVWLYGNAQAEEVRPDELADDERSAGVRYFARILAELDRALPDHGLKILLTWNLDAFDDRFREAVVILVGDEKHQIPSWAPYTRAIFKTGGSGLNPVTAALALPPAVAWRVMLRDVRDRALALRRAPKRAWRTTLPPIWELPLGYFGLVDVPFVPFRQRPVDVFFAGSAGQRGAFTVRPRAAARRALAAGLEDAQGGLPGLRIESAGSAGGFGTAVLSREAYSAGLMHAKVALCPRGNFDETFRLFEAAASGCVIVSEPLPDRWYYARAPVVHIRDWRCLDATLRRLFGDEEELEDAARRTHAWWREQVAERPVADFIRDRLASLGVA